MLLYSLAFKIPRCFQIDQKGHIYLKIVIWYLLFQYGLYASIVPGFLYSIFGSVKEATVGPTAVNALMAFEYANLNGVQFVHRCLTLSFFVGLIEISLGVLNLGNTQLS